MAKSVGKPYQAAFVYLLRVGLVYYFFWGGLGEGELFLILHGMFVISVHKSHVYTITINNYISKIMA